jgi:hypothetical protein
MREKNMLYGLNTALSFQMNEGIERYVTVLVPLILLMPVLVSVLIIISAPGFSKNHTNFATVLSIITDIWFLCKNNFNRISLCQDYSFAGKSDNRICIGHINKGF